MDKSALNEVSITKISVKKENLNNDIKEFAETAMNELLGWYGYSSRDDSRNISRTCRSHSGSNSSSSESPKFTDSCGWCSKPVEENTTLCSASTVFCSEACFSQSRRATFKKSKTCDWCRHVRHTVSYVDFHDGATQLQFCSDKCLNQYKMHIFCRETRAHLELHPHLPTENAGAGTLITPDLWLKNCKSPESRTPSPRDSPPPPPPPPPLQSVEIKPQTSPLPLISVAHPSKLMSISPISQEARRSRKLLKRSRKKYPATITCPSKSSTNDLPQDLRVRPSSNDLESPSKTSMDTTTPLPPSDQLLTEPRLQTSNFPPNLRPPDPRLLNPHYFTNPAFFNPLRRSLDLVPPPTVLVPYPLVLPLPIPIPIPIPIRDLNKKDKQNDKPNDVDKSEAKKTVVDAASQTDIQIEADAKTDSEDLTITTVSNEKVDVEAQEEENAPARPLRKRKKTVEKPKLILKSKVTAK